MIESLNELRSTVFSAFVFIILCNLCQNSSCTRWLYYKPVEVIIKNTIVYFCDFMSRNEASNKRKLEEIDFFYTLVLIFQCYPFINIRDYNDYIIDE
jgi:hypothetical protein